MHRFIVPAAVAAALLAAVAVPTAAQAAPRTVPVPEIGAVFSNGEHTSVHDGIAEMSTAPRMGIGSATGTTGFDDARVVVRDAQGREVCDTDDNGYDSDGGWECNATPSTLPVGTHTVRAVAYDADGTPSAESKPLRLTVTDSDAPAEDVVALPAPGDVDAGFTGPGNDGGAGVEDVTVQPAPHGTDSGFQSRIPKPDVSIRDLGVNTMLIIDTNPNTYSVEIRDGADQVVSPFYQSSGIRTEIVRTPAAGETATYTVTARNDFDRTTASTTVEIHGPDASAEDTTAQPAPGDVDPGFTAGGNAGGAEEIVAQPAPGDVDSGFTHPGVEDGSDFAAPTADWAYLRSIGGQQTVIAALHTRPGATVVVTESNGTVHRFTADGSGRVDVSMPWMGNASPAFTAVAHDGDAVSATATIMPTRG